MTSKQNETSQGIQVSKEFATQLQRLAAKFQSFGLTYIELKEQLDNMTKALLVKINVLETEKAELQEKLEMHEKPKPEKQPK